jgi:hypothetical protein
LENREPVLKEFVFFLLVVCIISTCQVRWQSADVIQVTCGKRRIFLLQISIKLFESIEFGLELNRNILLLLGFAQLAPQLHNDLTLLLT